MHTVRWFPFSMLQNSVFNTFMTRCYQCSYTNATNSSLVVLWFALLYSGQLVHSQVISISTNLLIFFQCLLFFGQYLQWRTAVKMAAVCRLNKCSVHLVHPVAARFFIRIFSIHSVVSCIDRQPSTRGDNSIRRYTKKLLTHFFEI